MPHSIGIEPFNKEWFYDLEWNRNKRPEQKCLHKSCSICNGSGKNIVNGEICVHNISCPCKDCSLWC